MDTTSNGTAVPGAPAAIRWYSRSALDEYLVGAEAERIRLEAAIAEANERFARASAALGLHQTMMEMLLESQRDVREIRRRADAESARTIADAERAAEQILGRDGPARVEPAPTVPEPGLPPAPSLRFDARAAEADDAFFTYLRGALDGDEPLGPQP